MKEHYKTTVVLVLLSVVLSSCSSTNSLTISVTEPPLVYLPADIDSAGIINRSIFNKSSKLAEAVDRILSVKDKDLDKDAAESAVNGLVDELNKSNMFSTINMIDNADLEGAGVGVFPYALDWSDINKICAENNVDVLFILSLFYTEAAVDYNANTVQIEAPLGLKVPAIEHEATIATMINAGWRIYDPVNKIIRDEFLIKKEVIVTGRGINPEKAIEAINSRKDAVLEVSKRIGQDYALSIFPYRTRVSRDYYVRGSDNFKIAKRRAQTGDWDGAADLWNLELSNAKRKVAGRAHYNMAIISEINGDMDAAIDWASKSYVDYKDKNALKYLNILKNRVERLKQLK
ncbi:MAG: DUF6340 family protein [Bacteroidota bacterium]